MASFILKVLQDVENIHLEVTVSQNFDICLSFSFMTKNGKIFSIFHKIKTRTYFKILRHGSLQINVFYRYVKWYFSSKNKSGKIDFQIPGSLISLFLYQCLYYLYFLTTYSSGYLMIQYRLG